MENNQTQQMKTAEEISDTLYKHYLEAYNKVQPGQSYPQWDINARWLYDGIEEIITQQTADLTALLVKANSDKEKMIALLKIAQRDYFMEDNKHQYKEVTNCLTKCGITD